VRRPARRRRGFSLVELILSLAIVSALLVATMVALRVCFDGYRATVEESSTQTVARLVMHRILAMVRTGDEFGPLPDDPRQVTVFSDEVTFVDDDGREIRVAFDQALGALTYAVDGGEAHVLLAGVERTADGDATVPPFTLEYESGIRLYRFSMDLTVVPDDDLSTGLDGGEMRPLRLVASAMPRSATW
jgi:prepilin-type N-terminal cleavage/methylation domain-containing protein